MASAPEPRKSVKPANTASTDKAAKAGKGTAEQSRIEAALKEATRNARQQLAAQGLKLPTQGWKRATIHNRVD